MTIVHKHPEWESREDRQKRLSELYGACLRAVLQAGSGKGGAPRPERGWAGTGSGV